jgi:hypothetical protein
LRCQIKLKNVSMIYKYEYYFPTIPKSTPFWPHTIT